MTTKYPFTKANVQETQQAVYDFIVEYISENAIPLQSVKYVAAWFEVHFYVHNHLRRLSEDGLIQFLEGKRRTIRVPALNRRFAEYRSSVR